MHSRPFQNWFTTTLSVAHPTLKTTVLMSHLSNLPHLERFTDKHRLCCTLLVNKYRNYYGCACEREKEMYQSNAKSQVIQYKYKAEQHKVGHKIFQDVKPNDSVEQQATTNTTDKPPRTGLIGSYYIK